MNEKILLDPEVILNKAFKIDFKGYSTTEVDFFLDQVLQDYIAFGNLLDGLIANDEKQKEIIAILKQKVTTLQKEVELFEAAKESENTYDVSNVDLIRRVSLLEREVFKR